MSNLEAIEPLPFEMSKFSGVNCDIFLQIVRLAGLTDEITFPQCELSHREMQSLNMNLKQNNLKRRHSLNSKTSITESSENTFDMDFPKLMSARTVESLTNAMVSNIIGEVTRRESVEKNLIDQERETEGVEQDLQIARTAQQKLIKCENLCIKLSWLQLAALKSLAVLLGCNKFLELLLLTEDDEGKTGHLASYSDKEESLSVEQEKKELSDNVFLKDALKFLMR